MSKPDVRIDVTVAISADTPITVESAVGSVVVTFGAAENAVLNITDQAALDGLRDALAGVQIGGGQ
jgi:hypothetical protein